MFKADNSIHAFVGGAYDKTKQITDSADGSVVILDKNGKALNAGSAIPAGTLIQVGQKDAAGNVRLSPLVEFKGATGLAYAEAVKQVQTLDLCDDTANTRYTLRLNFKHNVELFSQQSDLHFFEYTTGDAVVAGEVLENFETQINLAGGTKDKVVAAHSAGTDGMTITGKPQTFALGLHANTVVSFDCTITGFVAAATNLVTAAPFKGSGIGEQVAELEWFAVGSAGAPYRHGIVSNANSIALQAGVASNYNVASLDCVIPGPSYAVAGAGVGRCQIVIAMPTGDIATLDSNLGLSSVFVAES